MASLEGVLANIPGLSGYLAQGQYNQQQGTQGLQTVGTLIQLQNALRKQQEDQAFKAVLAESGGDIEKALPKLIQSGHIKDAAELAPLIKMKKDEESNAAFRKQFQEGGGNYTPEMLRTMGRYNFERGNHAAAAPLFSEADRMEKVATEKASLTGMKSLPAVPAVGEQGPNIPQPGQPGAVPDFLLKSKYVNTSAQALQDRINRGLIPSASAAEGELSRLATAHNAMAQAEAMQIRKEPDPGDIEANAKAIAEYRRPPLTGFALRSPGAQRIMSRVEELNPQYNAQQYVTSQKTRNSFSTGVEGRTTRSFNVAIDHLDTLNETVDALKNNDIKRFNQLAQRIGVETSNPAPTNFDAVKGIVAKELVKAVVGNATAGGVTERQELSNDLSRSTGPDALKEMIAKYQTLMAGQLKGLKQQYESGYGGEDFEQRFLLPRSREVFRKMQQGGSPKIQGGQVKFLGFEPTTP